MQTHSRNRNRLRLLSCFAIALLTGGLTAGSANAQYYGGISLGRLLPGGIDSPGQEFAVDNSLPTLTASKSSAQSVHGLRLAYPLANHLQLSGTYDELASSGHGTMSAAGRLALAPSVRAYGLDLVSAAPLFDRLSIFGRAGILTLRPEPGAAINGNFDAALPGLTQSATAARFGVGMRYDFSNRIGLRLEVERFRKLGGNSLGEFSADNYSLGVLLKF
jgi:hypothetical protein